MARTLDTELASAEEIMDYWENSAPIWEVRRVGAVVAWCGRRSCIEETTSAWLIRRCCSEGDGTLTPNSNRSASRTAFQQPSLRTVVHLLHRHTPPLPRFQMNAFDFPLHQLSEKVVEQDVCGLVLSVCVRMNQPFIDETGVNRVLFAEEPQRQPPQPQPYTAEPAAYRPFFENAGNRDAQPFVRERSRSQTSGELVVSEEVQVSLSKILASAQVQKRVLPEMLRVQECIERWVMP